MPLSTGVEIFRSVFWENWNKQKSPFEINWPLELSQREYLCSHHIIYVLSRKRGWEREIVGDAFVYPTYALGSYATYVFQ